LSLWSARDGAELVTTLESLPLYGWMRVESTPLSVSPERPGSGHQIMTTAIFAVDALAAFVVAADSTDLPDDAAMLLRRNVLDSVGCAIAAPDGARTVAPHHGAARAGSHCPLPPGHPGAHRRDVARRRQVSRAQDDFQAHRAAPSPGSAPSRSFTGSHSHSPVSGYAAR
jgi:hypothetical protein